MDEQLFQHSEPVRGSKWFFAVSLYDYRYRMDPVPLTGRRRGRYRYYKNPPHRREIASGYLASGDDLDLTAAQIYSLEKFHWVPDPWDDISKQWKFRSWKKYRSQQHR